jgi:error-prone DNA polymerase
VDDHGRLRLKAVYSELHCASAFSFLEGASLPEELAQAAARLGIESLALVDRDGVYGAPRFHKAARRLGLRPIVGAELTLADGGTLPLLVENRDGYQNLCRLITRMKLRSPKGEGAVALEELEEFAGGLVCLTGGEQGPLPRYGAAVAEEKDRRLLERLAGIFGRGNVYVEIGRHRRRAQEAFNRRSIELARSLKLPLLATNAVRHATPEGRAVLDVFTCLRHHTRLDHAGRLLAANSERHLKSPEAMAALFADLPEAVAETGELAARLQFTLENLGYEFPRAPVPEGETMATWLARLTWEGARDRYRPLHEKARRQIERELKLIEKLGLEGYFLIVHDIVRFCREHDILAQGRGSAANSAVCYSLGITAVDPVGMDLLFERFLSEERGEWPDIDIDLPSGDRRERVIQHVYERYGRWGAAMTANVITYRGRSAAREVGKALDFPDEMIGRLSHLLGTLSYQPGNPLQPDPAPGGENFTAEKGNVALELKQAGFDASHPRLVRFLQLCGAIQDLPRHLGQHSGGMVICQGALDRVVPLENASMPGRVVVQWDKDDCADLSIIKVDLLGLGMMAALQDTLRLVNDSPQPGNDAAEIAAGAAVPAGKSAVEADESRRHAATGSPRPKVDLAHLPPDDPAVYEMLQQADTVGIFQVESRAQMATLPRMRPRNFYDIVIEVALIRPGPIVGDLVHPYLARRSGREPVRYAHPALEPILKRTLGVPLFQEQLLRMAMAVADFTGGEAEELRRAFGFKRAEARMSDVEKKLRAGMARKGIGGAVADEVVRSITSFALYGFPESHSASFALLVYASAYLKAHYPAEFYTALLNNQPMGFYHPATLVRDAERHGVTVLPIQVNRSAFDCTVELAERRRDADGHPARGVRLGLRYVTGLRDEVGHQIEAARLHAPFSSLDDLRRRSGLNHEEVRTLAEIGALASMGMKRREALWQIERAWRPAGVLYEENASEEGGDGREEDEHREDAAAGSEPHSNRNLQPAAPAPAAAPLPAPAVAIVPSPLREMNIHERIVADFRGTGLTVGPHPLALRREELRREGVLSAAELRHARHGQRVKVAGVVIARQRPSTAGGILFISLEDETGIANVIVPTKVLAQQRLTFVSEPVLWIQGIVQNREQVVNVRAEAARPFTAVGDSRETFAPSHDFR